ncbi:hypothetical protein SEMRO_585_G171041.1 [Seminavis robusta]|uniref:Uncharacterized protein n=1 Tax=Seminavis robusta TaxID=568900 RepID=A0A9N8E2F6_9STRA|nr:hypothetical protein SEMRO_585_G171041.1 [Seminavis robusta]|eukprot:Sro585_g171041.1  (135) ;mRNA; f:41159-41563
MKIPMPVILVNDEDETDDVSVLSTCEGEGPLNSSNFSRWARNGGRANTANFSRWARNDCRSDQGLPNLPRRQDSLIHEAIEAEGHRGSLIDRPKTHRHRNTVRCVPPRVERYRMAKAQKYSSLSPLVLARHVSY